VALPLPVFAPSSIFMSGLPCWQRLRIDPQAYLQKSYADDCQTVAILLSCSGWNVSENFGRGKIFTHLGW